MHVGGFSKTSPILTNFVIVIEIDIEIEIHVHDLIARGWMGGQVLSRSVVFSFRKEGL